MKRPGSRRSVSNVTPSVLLIEAGAGPRCSGERAPQTCEGALEFVSPGPGLIDPQYEAVTSADENCSDVKDAIAEGLRLGLGEGPGETGELAPGKERARDEGDRQPGHVAHVVLEG